MILGIGTDIVTVERFVPWVDYSEQRLLRVFTAQEIADCRDIRGRLVAEKLAVRFAAKEAFYKALSSALTLSSRTQIRDPFLPSSFKPFSFLMLCKYVAVSYGLYGVPMLVIDYQELQNLHNVLQIEPISHLSLSHERTTALAFVVLERD